MLTLHHLETSQSERIAWLFEELALDYDLKRYKRDAGGSAPGEFKTLHPMGIAPVITDDDLTLAESGAICDYITARYGKGQLVPAESSRDFPDHLFWFHFANGTFVATLWKELVLAAINPENPTAPLTPGHAGVINFVADRREKIWALADKRLGETEYFGGAALTTADIMMVFPLVTGQMFVAHDLALFPNIRRYVTQISNRPAYKRAMERAEPDA